MISVDRLTLADLCILEAVGLLLGGEKLNILPKRALAAFEFGRWAAVRSKAYGA
jgi:hypothetical protein